jgi:hypothetical protein
VDRSVRLEADDDDPTIVVRLEADRRGSWRARQAALRRYDRGHDRHETGEHQSHRPPELHGHIVSDGPEFPVQLLFDVRQTRFDLLEAAIDLLEAAVNSLFEIRESAVDAFFELRESPIDSLFELHQVRPQTVEHLALFRHAPLQTGEPLLSCSHLRAS